VPGGHGRDVDGDDFAALEAAGEGFADGLGGPQAGGVVVGGDAGAEPERGGDGGEAEEAGLDGGGDGAAVDDVDADVGAAVHAGDDEVGRAREEVGDGELDAVGGSAVDGHAGEDAVDSTRWVMSGVARVMPWPVALWTVSGATTWTSPSLGQGLVHGHDARGADAVVIGEEDEHERGEYNRQCREAPP
jgi:hypothetical protein